MKRWLFTESKKRLILWGGIPFVCIFIILFLTHTPVLINGAGMLLRLKSGIIVRAKNFRIGPGFKGGIEQASLSDKNGVRVEAHIEKIDFNAGIGDKFRPEITDLVLYNPHIELTAVTHSTKSQETPDKRSLASVIEDFLEKIPTIKKMEVRGGKIDLQLFQDSAIQLTDIQLEVRNISPLKGGRLSFQSRLSLSPSSDSHAVSGNIVLSLDLVSLSPHLSGSGDLSMTIPGYKVQDITIQGFHLKTPIVIENSKILLTDMGIALNGLKFKEKPIPQLNKVTFQGTIMYDLNAETLEGKTLKVNLPGMGMVEGEMDMELHESFPWHCSLSARDFLLTHIPEIISPFLKQTQRGWSLNGRGGITARMQGRFLKEHVTLGGELALEWKGVGFNSPDSTKAGEGIAGSIHLELAYPQKEPDRISLTTQGTIEGGEYLWGSIYKDLKGHALVWESDSFFLTTFVRGQQKALSGS